jgi:DNA-binding transcriptional regulator/RsmH inhibitor MraZ
MDQVDIQMSENGRVVIPAEFRKALNAEKPPGMNDRVVPDACEKLNLGVEIRLIR